jgi:hypothetical protein
MAPVTRQQLKQLRHLRLKVNFTHQQRLLQLAQLPALHRLELEYSFAAAAAAATAPAWGLLPQLQSLVVVPFDPARDGAYYPTEQQLAAIRAGAAAATRLTRLVLDTNTVERHKDYLGSDSED